MEEVCRHPATWLARAAGPPEGSRAPGRQPDQRLGRCTSRTRNLTERASIVLLVLTLAACATPPAQAADQSKGTTPSGSSTNSSQAVVATATVAAASPTSAATATSKQSGKQAASDVSSKSAASGPSLDPQSSDLSSMYVQIPIAEPVEGSGVSQPADQQQQQQQGSGGGGGAESAHADANSSDSTKASTWTGPWPKKFQIGYIKQSDLHQVLIESLKNDPFLGHPQQQQQQQKQQVGAGPAVATPVGKTSVVTQAPQAGVKSAPVATTHQPAKSLAPAAPSDASSLMQSVGYPQLKAVQQSSMATMYGGGGGGRGVRLSQAHTPASAPPPTYGRLASPQVLPARPPVNSLHQSMRANLYQPALRNHHFMQTGQAQMMAPGFRSGHMGPHHAGGHQHQGHHMHAHRPGGQQAPPRHAHHQQLLQQQQQQQQQQPKLLPLAQFMQQQQQFQFAGNYQNFKNQPIYTMNSFSGIGLSPAHQQQPHQPMLDADQLQLIHMANGAKLQQQQQQVGSGRPPKSDYYHSSWRPVQTGADSDGGQLPNDGFDDGFGMPAIQGGPGGDSMNKHPVLNTYLGGGGGGLGLGASSSASGKASPAKMAKQSTGKTFDGKTRQPQQQQDVGATKSSGTKDASESEVQQRPEATKSGTERRALGGSGAAPTTTPSSATASPSAPTTTGSSSSSSTGGSAEVAGNSTASTNTANAAAATTTIGPGASAAATTQAPGDGQAAPGNQTQQAEGVETTTDPESEIIESATTEPSELEEATTTSATVTTTTAASAATTTAAGSGAGVGTTDSALAAGSRSSSTTPLPSGGGGSNNGGESEVVTQQSTGAGAGTGASFPAVQSDVEAESASASGFSSTPTPTLVTSAPGSNREETTPSSASAGSAASAAPAAASSSSAPGETKSGGAPVPEVEGASKGGSGSGADGDGAGDASDAASKSSRTDATLSDEALMAEAQRASDLTKSRAARQGRTQQKGAPSGTATSKKARSSSERLQQQQQQKQQQQQQQASGGAANSSSARGGRKTAGAGGASNRLITRKPSAGQRAAKQIGGQAGVKGAGAAAAAASGQPLVLATNARLLQASAQTKESAQKPAGGSGKKSHSSKSANASSSGASRAKSGKFTRMAAASQQQQQRRHSDRLQQATQVVSMSAAQAQSAAQTLASLLLSRCLSSTNCAHLLDVCSTKQAAVPFGAGTQIGEPANELANGTLLAGNSSSAAWSLPVGLMSSNLMSLMQALQADRALSLFPAWKDAIESVVDQTETQTGYTLIMPSNEAIERMPVAQIDALLANGEQMSQLIENHILDSAETIELAAVANGPASAATTTTATTTTTTTSSGTATGRSASRQTRHIKSKGLQINQHRDRMVTINGKRVVFANQKAPGGRIHVIDGLLDWPGPSGSGQAPGASNKLLDIMDTLKQCDKFDGFVTLAEGTGLTQILKQDEPLTVFVPSNEALRKIPDEELEVIKNNSTALREFIMYHIVNGSYFSQDLRDGQQLPSILDMRPIQVGVRVDGCLRRLVEANTSPMRRPDIVAKNGVIHILDWYLTTRDNEWCDPIGRPSLASASSGGVNSGRADATPSERLQQVASEPVPSAPVLAPPEQTAGYATRMSAGSSAPAPLPANHKFVPGPTLDNGQLPKAAKLTSAPAQDSAESQTNSVYVSAVPMGELAAAASQAP